MESELSPIVKVKIAGAKTKTLDSVPLTYAEVIRPIIIENPGITKLEVTWNGNPINDTADLFTAYLSNKAEQFHLHVEVEEKALTYADTATEGQGNSMMNKFQKMVDTAEEAKAEVTIANVNGFPTREGLLVLVREMVTMASETVLENSRRFMALR